MCDLAGTNLWSGKGLAPWGRETPRTSGTRKEKAEVECQEGDGGGKVEELGLARWGSFIQPGWVTVMWDQERDE